MVPCPLCPRRTRPVPSSGPVPCKLFLCGEGPGKNEDKQGRPFCGPAGAELDEQYLPLAGLDRESVRVGNAVACMWAEGGDAPPPSLVKSCSEFHLKRDLERTQPETLVLMGATAAALTGNRINLDYEHGRPFRGKVLGKEYWIFPTYHPALGLHATGGIRMIREDFESLGKFLRGVLRLPSDPAKAVRRRKLAVGDEVAEVMRGNEMADIAVDTESIPGPKLWSVQFALDGESGYFLRDREALLTFRSHLLKWRGRIYMHYAAHDWKALARWLDLRLDWNRVRCTMMMAYHRGLGTRSGTEEERVSGIGLKLLAYRLFGIRMTEFDELVRPYAEKLQQDYFFRVIESGQWESPKPILIGKSGEIGIGMDLAALLRKRGARTEAGFTKESMRAISSVTKLPMPKVAEENFKLYTPQPISAKCKRALTDWARGTNGIRNFSFHERWKNWDEGSRRMVEATLGEFPAPSIAMVPEEEAMTYAVEDARVTWLLARELERRKVRIPRIWS